jgi:hypothetical protein
MVDSGLWGLSFIIVGLLLIFTSLFMFRMPKSMVVPGMSNFADITAENENRPRRSSLSNGSNKSMVDGLKEFVSDAKLYLQMVCGGFLL